MFYETRFPTTVSQGSSGGPEYSTTIVTAQSGYELANSNWEYPRHKYNVALGVRNDSDIEAVLKFFHAMRGKAYGFRYKDWSDYKSCSINSTVSHNDQYIAVGDGVTKIFQLIKTYTQTPASLQRVIKKSVSGTVKVGKNYANQTSGWSANNNTGVITFSVAPAKGSVITAGYEFDVPCRFDIDYLPLTLETYRTATINDIPVIEVRV